MTRARPVVRRRELAVAALVAVLFTAAPTPGDIGGCGDSAVEVAPERYEAARKRLDCEKCGACGISNARCASACDADAAPVIALPATCRPLEQDANVCLRALLAASCSDFATYVDDVVPETPSECDFCHYVPDGGGE